MSESEPLTGSGGGGSTTTTDGGGGGFRVLRRRELPPELAGLAGAVSRAGSFTDLVVNIMVRFVIGVIIGLALEAAGIIALVFDIVGDGVAIASDALSGFVVLPFRILADAIWAFNTGIAAGITGGANLGIAAAPLAVGITVLEIVIVVRLLGPTLLALGEAASALPIVGGPINGVVTFGVALVGGVVDD